MIPSRLDYRCIKSGVGYGRDTAELGTVVTEFDSRHLITFFPQLLLYLSTCAISHHVCNTIKETPVYGIPRLSSKDTTNGSRAARRCTRMACDIAAHLHDK